MADIKNSKTPAVQGNALKNLTVDDIAREDLGVLAVRNPESYNQKLLGYVDPTCLQLRLQVSDKIIDIINKVQKNNYTVKIPIDIKSEPYYSKLGLTTDGLNNILALLPNLNLISAGFLLNSKDIENPCWKVSWDFDGVFGTQIAEFKGLVFSRHAKYDTEKGTSTWTNWGFHNDTQYIGATRFDFSKTENGDNFMGWIKVPANGIKLKRSEYPKLFDFLTKSGAYIQNKGIIKVNSGDLELSDPAGYFPRVIGQQTTGGISSNPDCSGAAPSDNYDYANSPLKNSYININHNFGYYVENVWWNRRWTSRGGAIGSDSVENIGSNRIPLNLNKNLYLSYSGENVSNNETRPKSKFYNLLIYAGYPKK